MKCNGAFETLAGGEGTNGGKGSLIRSMLQKCSIPGELFANKSSYAINEPELDSSMALVPLHSYKSAKSSRSRVSTWLILHVETRVTPSRHEFYFIFEGKYGNLTYHSLT